MENGGIIGEKWIIIPMLHACLLALFLHYVVEANINKKIKKLCKVSTFFPGVVILFAMSGFLVSASFEKSKDKKEFFQGRSRISGKRWQILHGWICTEEYII